MYTEYGYIECGYFQEENLYVVDGYIVDGYIEGCAQSDINISFVFPYLFLKPTTLELKTFDYIFFAARELKKDVVIYLYDNQITLEPLRIVREKNT